ncbi:MAG: hypothetical protein KJ734_12185, partial [Chloroflexi bacterium]|nr:hypothetical protein [Chloroflexota bacterium]
MPTIVGIRFRRTGKVYYFDPADHDLHLNDWAIVETSYGQEMGQVVIAPRQVAESEVKDTLKPVVRPATCTDLRAMQAYRLQESDALPLAREEAERHHLPIKIIGAEYSFDGSRLTFYFTSEGRVDFRNLVRDLARTLKARIDMRQAGVRDETRLLDGIGICGRQFCCASFLDSFDAVSIRMAKAQGLPLNPTKISGQCGRLLCCLSYEYDFYCEAKARLPKPGTQVETIHGMGRLIDVNVLTERLTVEYEPGKRTEITLEELGPPTQAPPTASPAPSQSQSEPATAEPARKRRRRKRRKPRPTESAPAGAATPQQNDTAPKPERQQPTSAEDKPRPTRRRRR